MIDPWNCLTYTSYCHQLWRHLGYNDKSLLTFQDVDDSVSSKGELEWLLFMECKLAYPLERQKILPYKHTVERGKSVYKKVKADKLTQSVEDRLKMRFIIPDGYDEKTKTCYFSFL